ncbi:MAG: Nif3-like dinuclear metal center hexameric protein [Acidimicrobiia bacterium]|nr:Nif3-like dinuclear metal center hexameric protein [Acidimicrobiia bacterium]
MSLSIGEFLHALHGIVPAHAAADWDPGGLQIGDPDSTVSRVAVCHEITEKVVAGVESDRVDVVVTYHPLLFRPQNRLTAGKSPAGRAFRLIRAGCAVVVAHTAFDVMTGGTADALASALGLSNVRPFADVHPPGSSRIRVAVPDDRAEAVLAAMTAAGAGEVVRPMACRPEEGTVEVATERNRVDAVLAALAGTIRTPTFEVVDTTSTLGHIGRIGTPLEDDLDSLAAAVEERLGAARVAGDRDSRIGRVAVVPGSGDSFIGQAVASGADAIVTGDLSHHTIVEARDRGLAVIDAGHAPTERPGMVALVAAVTAAGPGTEVVDLTGLDPTPWR